MMIKNLKFTYRCLSKFIPYSLDQRSVKPFNTIEKYTQDDKLLKDNVLKNFKSTSHLKCHSCGAGFQSQSSFLPGYIEKPLLEMYVSEQTGPFNKDQSLYNCDHICVRCKDIYTNIMPASQVYLSPESLNSINDQNRVILYCVDMTNIPHCIDSFIHKISPNSSYILCLTKCDLNPIDSTKSIQRWMHTVEKLFINVAKTVDSNFTQERILHSIIVSAKTGYGINQLVDLLVSKRFSKIQTSFLITGCINSGKSSLFNRLLLSDACSNGIRGSIQRSAVHAIPATTCGPLWFPRNRMNSVQRYNRVLALREIRNVKNSSETAFKTFPNQPVIISSISDADKSLYSSEMIDSIEIKSQGVAETHKVLERETYGENIDARDSLKSKDYLQPRELQKEVHMLRKYNKSNGFFDLPPIQSDRYLLGNELSQREYASLMYNLRSSNSSSSFIKPRIFSIREGMVIGVSLFAAVIVERLVNCRTAFLSTQTLHPIHIMDQDRMREYYEKHFTGMIHHEVLIAKGRREEFYTRILANYSSGNMFEVVEQPIFSTKPSERINFEVVLSDIGWLGFAPGIEEGPSSSDQKSIFLKIVLFSPLDPNGYLARREHPLLPFVLTRRGKRIPYSREYSVQRKSTTHE